MRKKTDGCERARISILSELMSFPTVNQVDWNSGMSDSELKRGDLVSLCSAPPSKWYLSWLEEVKLTNGFTKYLLKSIEDGSLCWWENVGLNVYSRKRRRERPKWKWSDKQFAFNDRWNKVCFKWNGAHTVLPCLPEFKDEGSVVLSVRIRFNFSNFTHEEEFPNWKKLTMKKMDSFFKEGESLYDKHKKENK